MTTTATFDPTCRLGPGVTVLEASAGTGKTHAVASIVVAEVAAGRPLDELLVVTFTRKATGTLRERVWQRLAAAAGAVGDALSGGPAPRDVLLEHLVEGSEADLRDRHHRLVRAVAELDAATIATTHGFCQQVLASLGVAGDAERDLEVVESVRDIVEEAVDDLFVRRFHAGGEVLFERSDALAIAAAVVGNPDAAIAAVDDNDADRLRRRFAVTLRARIDEHKRRGRLVTYDDLLTRLAGSLTDPERGQIVAERLRRRYSMAIVDEFQDTDTVQWRILREAFGAEPSRLVLVGDPKQAVYAFRGGDVHAYLQATADATTRLSLDVSWRSDQPLLDGLDAIFDHAELGDATIAHRPLHARPGADGPGLVDAAGAPFGAPVTVKVLDRASGLVACTPKGYANKQSAIAAIGRDVAAEARRVLGAGLRLVDRDEEGDVVAERPLVAADIAVLVRRNREADLVRDALVAAGVPAVVHGGAGVLTTEAATAWLTLLRALESPAMPSRVRAAATGPFLGWDATRLATAGEDEWEDLDERIHDWAAVLRARGVAALVRRIETTSGLTARLLATDGGARAVADLRHVAELLDVSQGGRPSSVAALVAWLSDRIADVADGELDDSRRRLASDADAVGVHTVHGAKGLEFPVVLVPTMWTVAKGRDDALPVFHDADGERCIGVGGSGDLHRWQVRRAAEEQSDEELRLLYVALTRARHRVVVWWASALEVRESPLGRMLMGREADEATVARELRTASAESAVRARVAELAARCGGAVEVVDVGRPEPSPTVAPPDPAAAAALTVARTARVLDPHWVRTSYSGLTASVHDAGPVATDPGRRLDVVEAAEDVVVDEPSDDRGPDVPPADGPLGVELPLSAVPGGARVGTMVHEVLEHTDFAAPDLRAELASAAGRAGAHRLVEGHVDTLVAGLAAAIETPLGPTFGDRALRGLGRVDRLDELAFDLPLAGGDRPTGSVTVDAIADVFDRELPEGDVLAGYGTRLRDPRLAAEVRGYLTGSIDLVARHGERHVVIDHKTNRLAPAGEPLTPWHYRPAALATAMLDAHYPLQAALYEVALHRYLRWRLPGYDPERHLGGVAYLFLRGMAGADAPRDDGAPCGVFAWHPPAAFVVRLSEVLDRGGAR